VTGECATCDVPATATATTPTASSPTQTSIALKHGECITEEDEDEKVESPKESTLFPPVKLSDN